MLKIQSTNDLVLDNEINRFIRGWGKARTVFYFDGMNYPKLEQDLIYAFAIDNITMNMIDELKAYTNQILIIITNKDMLPFKFKYIKQIYDIDFGRWGLWVWQKNI